MIRETSHAAHRSVQPGSARLRETVLQVIQMVPSTDEAIQAATGMPGNTQRPRRGELVALGLVRDSGERRVTRSGRRAIVWEAA